MRISLVGDARGKNKMPEQKKKMDIFGHHQMDVTDVPQVSATEHFNEYVLEDGSVLRVKMVATSFLRLEGQFTPDGKPVYIVTPSSNTVVLASKITKPVPATIETKH